MLEVAGLLLDDLAGDVQHARIGLRQVDGPDIVDGADFLGRAQGGEQQRILLDLDGADPLARAHDQFPLSRGSRS